ncbi:MAG: hypothetical protein ACJ72D_00025, partial [Marmoricola sp.]
MRAAAVAAVLAAGLLTSCGNEQRPTAVRSHPPLLPPTNSSVAATPKPTATAPVRTGTTVITANSKYGRMLYDAGGQPIYLFDKEIGSVPRCYAACAEAWPPVLTTGLPRARKGTRETLLDTTRRADGKLQVTYAGHPLYFYAREGKYQVTCHDVTEYGGTWLVVRP